LCLADIKGDLAWDDSAEGSLGAAVAAIEAKGIVRSLRCSLRSGDDLVAASPNRPLEEACFVTWIEETPKEIWHFVLDHIMDDKPVGGPGRDHDFWESVAAIRPEDVRSYLRSFCSQVDHCREDLKVIEAWEWVESTLVGLTLAEERNIKCGAVR
jgi:hypothetical protein